MLSTVYVACLLAASAIASPVQHNPRYVAGSYSQDSAHSNEDHARGASSTPFGSSSYSSDRSSSDASHQSVSYFNGGSPYFGGAGVGVGGYGNYLNGGYGASGYNGASAYNGASGYNGFGSNGYGINNYDPSIYGGGASSFNSASSFSSSQQSYSMSTVNSAFSSLNSYLENMNSRLISGQITQQAIYQVVQQITQYFESAMSQATYCGECINGQSQFSSVASSSFSQFTSFMNQVERQFGGDIFNQFSNPMSSLSTSMQSFFHRASSSSTTSQTFIPSGFSPLAQRLMPDILPSLSQFLQKK